MSQMGWKCGELDLDLLGQIALEALKFGTIPCECNNF